MISEYFCELIACGTDVVDRGRVFVRMPSDKQRLNCTERNPTLACWSSEIHHQADEQCAAKGSGEKDQPGVGVELIRRAGAIEKACHERERHGEPKH